MIATVLAIICVLYSLGATFYFIERTLHYKSRLRIEKWNVNSLQETNKYIAKNLLMVEEKLDRAEAKVLRLEQEKLASHSSD